MSNFSSISLCVSGVTKLVQPHSNSLVPLRTLSRERERDQSFKLRTNFHCMPIRYHLQGQTLTISWKNQSKMKGDGIQCSDRNASSKFDLNGTSLGKLIRSRIALPIFQTILPDINSCVGSFPLPDKRGSFALLTRLLEKRQTDAPKPKSGLPSTSSSPTENPYSPSYRERFATGFLRSIQIKGMHRNPNQHRRKEKTKTQKATPIPHTQAHIRLERRDI